MAKETIAPRDHRTLVIKNYRNFAPFCAGTKDDSDDLKEFLELNRGLSEDELGGLVVLISANNCGKTNLLNAIEKYNSQEFTEDDFTDFTYAKKIKPSIGMNVANGQYGNFRKAKRITVYKGAPAKVLLALALESRSYSYFLDTINKTKQERNYLIEEGSGKESPESDGRPVYEFTKLNFIDKMYGVLQGPITYDPNRVYYGNNQNITDPFLLQLYDYLKPVCDRSDILPDCLKNHNSSRFWNQQIEVKSTGKPFDEYLFKSLLAKSTPESESVYLRNKDNSRVQEIYNALAEVTVSYETEYEKDLTSNGRFLEKFGYELNDEVHRYTRNKIRQKDLVCKPNQLNTFILNLFTTLGYDKAAIDNAYAGAGNLRHKVEREMNRALEKLSDELNDLLNINEKKYSLQIELERENIELIITYGDEVPLNLDRQSEGFTWLFDLFFNLIKLKKFSPGDIILLDEFGNSLSFATIGELTKKLREYAKKNGLTFVLATQNPMAIDSIHLDEVRLLVPRDDGSTHIINDFDQFGGERNHDIMKPILSGLTVSRNFMRSENRVTVFVEGATDYFYLNAVSEALRAKGQKIDIDFIPINGLGSYKDNPKEVLKQILSIERNPTIFTDSDKAGQEFKKRAESMNVHPSDIAEILGDGKKEIEDAFSQSDAEKLGIRVNGEVNKKFDHAACLSYKIPKIYDSLDDETQSNFEKIIDYICSQ